MIEWVPIKDFKWEVGQEILICHQYPEGRRGVGTWMCYDHMNIFVYGGNKVTHAAPLNFPVEKTLEEKFKDWAKGNKVLSSPAYFPILAQIAKEHYEGLNE